VFVNNFDDASEDCIVTFNISTAYVVFCFCDSHSHKQELKQAFAKDIAGKLSTYMQIVRNRKSAGTVTTRLAFTSHPDPLPVKYK
jgi:hypothetical protein